ncbi:MAG TPA: DUF4450 domain-containing protein [Opitutaceae bacterium]|nr:DUF4450 domain-containing protein [Opitutaceae bacterium]HND61265.1 DUF4450 domain-containing protein [Opitutaceae bacterium]
MPSRPSRYSAVDRAIVLRQGDCLFNRPLYLANTNAFVLAGERPALRFGSGDTLHGTLFFGLVRDGSVRWLHDASDRVARYHGAMFSWSVRDRDWPGLALELEVVGASASVSFAFRLTASGARAGDRLIWVFGGARTWPGQNLNWELDPHKQPAFLNAWFDPAWCAGNRVEVQSSGFSLAPAGKNPVVIHGACDAATPAVARNADLLDQPAALLASSGAARPILVGEVDLAVQPLVHWVASREQPKTAKPLSPVVAFVAGLGRAHALADRLVVETPDARLNAAAAVLPAALDGLWYPPVFRHGAMLWNNRYPGWRTVFGGTVLDWPERVLAQVEFYCGHQVTSNRHRSHATDPIPLHALPAQGSRFYGRGRILEDQGVYNMQSQFFDQLIHAWRWTGDEFLAARLRPALELHLEWLRECFDPDHDGLYESFINTWPTDSVWYAGGAGTEETAYAYRAHVAARELAQHDGDRPAARRHARQAARIRLAFHRHLWVRSHGHAALYREPAGKRRVHPDATLYSLFLPIDAGLVTAEEAVASLLYAERRLQNDRMPCGGRQVWTSNFVPGIWSVRERWPGDNYHLALACFQAGLGTDGWELFRGTFLNTAFDQLVPGDFGATAGGTDFGDCTHMFARTLVEGLFGFAPDRADGVVRVSPQLPAAWNHALMQTPEVRLEFARKGSVSTLTVELSPPATRLILRLPICARGIKRVTVDGRETRWQAEPGYGQTFICVDLPHVTRAELRVEAAGKASRAATITSKGNAGDLLTFATAEAKVESFSDPQRVLAGSALRHGRLTARLAANPGWHTVHAQVRVGELPQLRRWLIHVTDPAAARLATAQRPGPITTRSRWHCVDLAPVLNGDVRTIYSQEYVTPRTKTISVRLGTDGYSPWTFRYWNTALPKIQLDAVPGLLDSATGRLRTPAGVPFAWPGEARNIAFTSHWDNWPDRVTVPVNAAGDAVWFLVCGSTNPMQNQIANAVLRLRYSTGPDDALELVPPHNYWNLCPIRPGVAAPGQESRGDYTDAMDAFCVPKPWPQTVQLGENCRAMVLGRRLRKGAVLKSVTLETLSPEVWERRWRMMFSPLALMEECSFKTADFVGARMQSKRRKTVSGRMTLRYSFRL